MSDTTARNYSVHKSRKLGGNWQQNFVVVRNNEAFLRFVGDHGQHYRMMTATTGGDFPNVRPCNDQKRLHQAAKLLAELHGFKADLGSDHQGRTYVMPFEFGQETNESDEEFIEEVHGWFNEFFRIYDELR